MRHKQLSQDDINQTLNKLGAHAVKDEYAELKNAEAEIVREIYNTLVPAKVHNFAVKNADVFKFVNELSIQIYVKDTIYDQTRYTFCRKEGNFLVCQHINASWVHNYESAIDQIPGASPILTGKISAHIKAVDAMENKRLEVKAEAKKILYSHKHTKKLLEFWPEVKNFLPKYITNDTSGAPAKLPAIIDTSIVNKLANLK